MDIQVGDRVTFKDKNDNKIKTIIVDCNSEAKNYENDFETNYHEILKIERTKYEIVEEEKELLTEEEKEFLKQYIKFHFNKIIYIRKLEHRGFSDTNTIEVNCEGDFSYEFYYNKKYFKNLKLNFIYTLEELGL